MAYEVGKQLDLRPMEIMKTWKCEELLVAFGVYMNERMAAKYAEYKALDSKEKAKIKPAPTEYAVKFITFNQLEEMSKPKSAAEIATAEAEKLQAEAFLKGGATIG